MNPLFPTKARIEGIPVDAFETADDLIQRALEELRTSLTPSVVLHLNVQIANMAHQNPRLKNLLTTATLCYCDGAGIVWASKQLGGVLLPRRFTAVDWLKDAVNTFSLAGKTMFFLGGTPDIPDLAQTFFDRVLPGHQIVGFHHGYILNSPTKTAAAIAQINACKPDIVFVGFGCPLQEYWIEEFAGQLDTKMLWAIGATLDYYVGKIPTAPRWIGDLGLEWLFRLLVEPVRLFERYVVGNPQFVFRILKLSLRQLKKD
jgi:N-acetylglucosaminyldiphosphoundecaprenol N-acetyl-beta-D-mannosaminyltransferase